jgi:hypothetical protein
MKNEIKELKLEIERLKQKNRRLKQKLLIPKILFELNWYGKSKTFENYNFDE